MSAYGAHTFAYSDRNVRYRKTINGVNTWYITSGLDVLAEYQDNDVLQREYIYGPNGAIAIWEPGKGYFWLMKDHLGSVRKVDNSAMERDYMPYGDASRATAGAVDAPIQFTGKELDSETGLYYFGMRYYNVATGRWLVHDPAAQFASPYAYGASPLMGVDADGEFFLGALLLGGIINAGFNSHNIDNWGDFGKYFGYGALQGGISFLSGGMDKVAMNLFANKAWEVGYRNTGLNSWVNDNIGSGFNKTLDIFGPMLVESGLAYGEGSKDGLELYRKGEDGYRNIPDELMEDKNHIVNMNPSLYGADTKWNGDWYGKYNGKEFWIQGKVAFDQSDILAKTLNSSHFATAFENAKSLGDVFKYGTGLRDFTTGKAYGLKGLCHQCASRSISKLVGKSLLPTQVLPHQFNIAFWQSLYGQGTLNFAPIWQSMANYNDRNY